MITLTYSYTKEGSVYTGWINELNGVFAMGNDVKELEGELLKILNIKLELLRKDAEETLKK
jgi:hypothetical protein